VKVVDPVTFAARLNAKAVCTVPAGDINTFADQLDRIITDVLDQLVPRRTQIKHCGKQSTNGCPTMPSRPNDYSKNSRDVRGECSLTLSSPSHGSLITNSDCKKELATRV